MSDLIRMSGWVRKLTDHGTVYYVHRSSGESRYVPPYVPFIVFFVYLNNNIFSIIFMFY